MSAVTPTIYSNNKALPQKYQLVMVDILREFNRVPDARIILIDGDPALQKYEAVDSGFFDPGAEIEIRIRYEQGTEKEETFFKGLVLRQTLKADDEGFLLTVELRHKAFMLTTTRKNAVYTEKDKKDDNAIVSDIIKAAGLTVSGKMDTTYKHKQLVRYDCSDWDFILSRLDSNGCVLLAGDDAMMLKPIKEMKSTSSGGGDATLQFGVDDGIYALELDVDAGSQVGAASSVSWDIKKQSLVVKNSAPFTPGFGNLKPDAWSKKIKSEKYLLMNPAPVEEGEAEAWANAKLAKSKMSLVRGVVKMRGRKGVKPGDVIAITGLGSHFKGSAVVSGVRHQVGHDAWNMEVQLGLSAEWYSDTVRTMQKPAMGLVPGIHGLHIGVVTSLEEDPDKHFRVQVSIPAFKSEKEGVIWARWASLYAGKERGMFFLPEVGDEVVVGFFNDDPRQAVILGSLYSSTHPIPKDLKAEKKNLDKGIVTRTGARIRFRDDEKAIIEVATPGKNSITLDDDKKAITIVDQHGNTVELSDKGITLKSKKDFVIDAGGNVTIKGSKIEVK